MIRFKYLILVVVFIFMGVGNVGATEWEVQGSQTTEDSNKAWIITFNSEVNEDSINNTNVYVEDENTRLINNVKIGNKPNEVIVESPMGGYEEGKTYTLYIKDVESKTGKKLSPPVKMDFVIQQNLKVSYLMNTEKEYTYYDDFIDSPDSTQKYYFTNKDAEGHYNWSGKWSGGGGESLYISQKETSEGLYSLGFEDRKILAYPVENNKTWSDRHFTYIITSINKEVEVKAGTFKNVVEVKRQPKGDNDYYLEYYAPNIGLIMRQKNSKDTEYKNRTYMELMELTNK